jgi:hypothetical protein
MKQRTEKFRNNVDDPLLPYVIDYLNKFDFPLAYLIQKKFKIGFSRAERILKQIEAKKTTEKNGK